MKKTTKKFKPTYLVELDNIKVLDDIDFEWAMAKHEAHLALTDDELVAIVERARMKVFVVFGQCNVTPKKKAPWYKRFWKWLRRK